MMIAPSISDDKIHHLTPIPQSYFREGCPCQLTPFYKKFVSTEGSRTKLIHEYTTMLLLHQSKNGQTKNSLSLNPIHRELELDSLLLQQSGSSNMLISKVSFDCFVRTAEGEDYRDYLTFDLRIPGTNTQEEGVLSYEMLVSIYGDKKNLYSAIEHFFKQGRRVANTKDVTHGHKPDYQSGASGHDQFIRHTEQLLVAYLALPQAAQMLHSRLRSEIRAKYPGASRVKVYNMGLHMHSTKTCCAPCEYTLLGLMNDQQILIQNGKILSFIQNFKHCSSIANEQLTFALPKKSPFRLLVTVTANQPDINHQKQALYSLKQLKPEDPIPPFVILVKKLSKHIYMTKFDYEYDRRRLSEETFLSEKSVMISGSKATRGSPNTIERVKSVQDGEITRITKGISDFKV